MAPNSKKRTLLEFIESTINIALILLFPLSRPFQDLCKEVKEVKGKPWVMRALAWDTPAEVAPALAKGAPAEVAPAPAGVAPSPAGDTPTEEEKKEAIKGARRLKELGSKIRTNCNSLQ